MLKGHRELLKLVRETAVRAQADLAAAIRTDRNIEARIIIEKIDHLRKVARGEAGKTDGGKPKRKRNSRRS